MKHEIKSAMMKLFFCTIMLFCCPVVVNAADISASSNVQSVQAGDTVDVTVSIQGNTGIESAAFEITYDNTALQYRSYDWDSSVSGNEDAQVVEWDNAVDVSLVSESGYTANGTLVTLHFEALGEAADLAFPVNVFDITEYEAGPSEETASEETDSEDNDSEEEEGSEIDEDEYAYDEDEDDMEDDEEEDIESSPRVPSQTPVRTGYTSVAAKQRNSVQSVSAKADKNYKTGIRLGVDVYLIIAAVAGIAALLLMVRRQKGKEED